MKKKIVTGITTLGLSLGLIGTAGASVPQITTSDVGGGSSINSEVEPYNMQRYHSEPRLYSKADYPMSGSVPSSIVVVLSDGYSGRINKIGGVEEYKNDWWKVTYGGMVTKYEQ